MTRAPASSSHPLDGAAGADRRELSSAWALAAEDVDDVPLAAALWSQVDDPRGTSGRARLALLAGDAAGALALLETAGVADVPADGPRNVDHLVVLGCRAALGRQDELSRLVAAGSTLPAQVRLTYLYVLGAAAEGAGQQALADDVWLSVVADHGVRTPHALSRCVAAWVQGRRGTDPRALVTRVAQGAHELVGAVPRPWEDVATLEATTRLLVARGDAAGAALLTAAVCRLGPRSEALDALEAAHAPRRRISQRVVPFLVLVVALGLSMVLVRHGLPGMILGAAAIRASRRWWPPVHGMSVADGRAWDALVALRFDERSGQPQENLTSLRLLPSLGAVCGLGVGVPLGVWWGQWALDPVHGVPVQVAGVVFGLCWLVVPSLAVWAGVRADRERRRRAAARTRAEVDAAELEQAATCRCWQVSALVGRFAERYATSHLGVATGVLPVAGRAASVRVCPLSGMRWLATASLGGAGVVLLRGPGPGPVAPAAPAAPGTGGYI
ncbi:hypothetical protein J1G44_00325 [Cellulomonas sp. zg-ZUI199]|uniref:Uncharacterized protein n=1 Tax=Cellulomonas wangleii TaxID=2816956 RepID=A0ABX8D2S1_9CELL|nr:hypothetical protein [Cellulomonas wangleii]MBO0922927.1 hypothetical protein [Cellulomonas wangleii]QVI61323.1 hypothetical protein KG103_12610 [Cellulomonas wangleii]